MPLEDGAELLADGDSLSHVSGSARLRDMHLPYVLRRINRVFTNPVLGTIAWLVPPMAVICHVGRKSGRKYRTPVVAFRCRRGFVVPMTYGRDVDWGRNIIKARGCELAWMGRRFVLRNPRIVDGATAYPDLPIGVRSVLKAANLPGFVLLELSTKQSRKKKWPRHPRGQRRDRL